MAEVSPNSLRYAAVAGAAICSYIVFTSGFWGMAAVGISPLLIGLGSSYYVYRSVASIARTGSQSEQMQKADFIARVILGSALLLAGIGCGAAAGYFATGMKFLITGIRGANAFVICRGAANLLFTLGYSVPALKFLFSKSPFLHARYDSLMRNLSASLRNAAVQPFGVSFVALLQNLLGGLGFLWGDSIDFNTFISVAAYLPEELLIEQFLLHVPTLSDETVSKIVEHFPNTLTIDLLALHLPQGRFEFLFLPRLLEAPFDEHQLRQILTQIVRLEVEASLLEEGAPDLEKKIERISTEFSQHQKNLIKLRNFIQRLPKEGLPDVYHDLDERIQELLLMGVELGAIEKLVQEKGAVIRPHLQRLRFAEVGEEENDPEEANYEVLGSIGLREPEFKMLGKRLGISDDELKGREIQRTCEELDKEKHGLAMRKNLEKNGILKKPYTVPEVIDRIVQFCENKSRSSFWGSIPLTIQTIFNRALFCVLLTIQVANSPITIAAFVWGLTRENRQRPRLINWINMDAIYDPSTEFNRNHSFEESVRSLYWRTSAVVWSVLTPFGVGGFFAGMRHAEAFRAYLSSFRGRVHGCPRIVRSCLGSAG